MRLAKAEFDPGSPAQARHGRVGTLTPVLKAFGTGSAKGHVIEATRGWRISSRCTRRRKATRTGELFVMYHLIEVMNED